MLRRTESSGHILNWLLSPSSARSKRGTFSNLHMRRRGAPGSKKSVGNPHDCPLQSFLLSSLSMLSFQQFVNYSLCSYQYWLQLQASGPGILLVRYGSLYSSVSLVFRETGCPMMSILCGSKKSC